MIKMLIDAKGLIIGRLGTFVAKKALLGERVDIINCEKAVISGRKEQIMARYKQRQDMGAPKKGPFLPRMPHLFVKRIIRGMFPMEKARGREALKRVRCHIGVPEQFKGKAAETVQGANADKLPILKKVSVAEVCKFLGGTWHEVE